MQSSNTILDGLRSEGLLAAFGQKTGGSGIKFEVMIAPEFGVLKKPPTRLKKLKKIKKQKELTHEELEAKMKAAEERRKVSISFRLFISFFFHPPTYPGYPFDE